MSNKIRRWIGDRLVLPLVMWWERKTVEEVWATLSQFRQLATEWHRLAANDTLGHLAYRAMDTERSRLRTIPLPTSAFAWLGSDGSMRFAGANGDYASLADSLHGYTAKFAPANRRVAYLAMGWKYSPPPSEEEMRWWGLMSKAMRRMEGRHTKQTAILGIPASMCVMDEDYFKELGANMHEIEAELSRPNEQRREE